MTADAVQTVRMWLDAYVRRDADDLVRLADPDIVIRPFRWVPEREYRGAAGVRAWIAAVRASPSVTTMRFNDVREDAPGRVIVEGVLDDEQTAFTSLVEVVGGRIASVRAYWSECELLERLGVLDAEQPR
jgi:ketosteroid isomerase-like protein